MRTAVIRQMDGPMFSARYRVTINEDDLEPRRFDFDFPHQADEFLRDHYPEISEAQFISITGKHFTHEMGDWKEPS